MSTKIIEVITCIEKMAPLDYQESWDNSGLQVGDPNQDVKAVLLCVDITEATIDEAIAKGVNLIISHHPLIFRGVKKITGKNYIERVIIKAIQNNIVLYSAHTNMDKCVGGVNFRIAEKLGLKSIAVLAEEENIINQEQLGLGCIGKLENPLDEEEVLRLICSNLQVKYVRHTKLLNRKVSKIALCGGAGSEFISLAIAKGADLYITSDVKYHDFFSAENQIVIVDIGHFESEQCIKDVFCEQLSKNFINFAILKADSDQSPVEYYYTIEN